jgi:hypothetical protein
MFFKYRRIFAAKKHINRRKKEDTDAVRHYAHFCGDNSVIWVRFRTQSAEQQ